ncbi:MAG: redoxin domain-containing protein [Bacteroidales bacterium]|jgi:peroxiredoxin|nr:redoxin domain-containing protein [Bacteroidales bacterium]
MKKLLFLLSAAGLLLASSCTPKDPNAFTFKGQIGELNAPATVYFGYFQDGAEIMDTAVLENGKFAFEGTATEPSAARIFLDYTGEGLESAARAGQVLYLYVGPEAITLESKDSLLNGVITGKANDEFNRYQEFIGGPIQNISAKMNQKMWDATPEQQADPAFKAQLDVEFRALHAERQEKQREFVKQNPTSFFSVVAITEATPPEFNVEEVEPLFMSISEDLRNTATGQAFAVRLNAAKNVVIGKEAPDFTQNDPNGNPIKLSDFRGKYVLLDFWASWCGPCRQENPNLVKAYAQYKDKGFEILGVSLDEQKRAAAWTEAIEKDGMTWAHVSDLKGWNNEAARMYGIRAVPNSFLIDPNGVIIAKNLRAEELFAFLENLFNK